MKNILYLVDNEIIYYSLRKNNIFIKKIPHNILYEGKVASVKLFSKYLIGFFKEHNLINNIFLENISVLINNNYTTVDKDILIDILEKIPLKKPTFIKISTLLNLCNVNVILDKEYINIYYKNKSNKIVYSHININLFDSIEILKLLRKKTNGKTVYYLGNNPNIINLLKECKEYVYQNPKLVLFNIVSNL